MDILATSRTTETSGADIRINCPRCHRRDVMAATCERQETMGLFFIPLLTQQETLVRCRECNTELVTRLPLLALQNRSAVELESFLAYRLSFVYKALAILSVVLCCVPFVSLPLALIALVASYRSGGWPKIVSITGIILAMPMTALLIYNSMPE